MARVQERLRQVFLGTPVDNRQVASVALPKRRALPLFGSDGVSSVSYAPDEIVMTLAVAGSASLVTSPWVGFAIALVLLIVVGTYRYNLKTIAAGGDYELVQQRLGKVAGVATGASLMVDFMLTVAVSASAASGYVLSVVPGLRGHERALTIAMIAVMMLLCLRGLRFLGRIAFVPLYAFLLIISITLVYGYFQDLNGTLEKAATSSWEVVPTDGVSSAMNGIALFVLMMRTFSSGAVALTGVSTVSNSVRFFKKPKASNAAATMMMMGGISALLLIGVLYMVRATGAVAVLDTSQLRIHGMSVGDGLYQVPVLIQMAEAVYASAVMPVILVAVTVAMLLVAIITAFTGFPQLTNAIAEKGYLPVHLRTKTSPHLHANSVLILGVSSMVLVALLGADLNTLIQLYIVGVFLSMTLTQAAIIKYRWRDFKFTVDRYKRRPLIRQLAITLVGFVATFIVFWVVLLTKLTHGAWITLIVIAVLSKGMLAVRKHYNDINRELELPANAPELAQQRALPSRVHAVVYVPRVRKPLMRAISYARATRPSTIEAVLINQDPKRAKEAQKQWRSLEIPVPLVVLDAPFRDAVQPFIEYVQRRREETPRDVIVVYLPEYVVPHWWERLLHRRIVHRLKAKLRYEQGIVIASVPWQLEGASAPGQHTVEAHVETSTYTAEH